VPLTEPRENGGMSKTHQEEVDENYSEFIKALPNILPAHHNKFALMKDGKIIAYFSSAEDSTTAAHLSIQDGLFSIQQVTDAVIDLGFYNYAVPIN
jgi:hypothetical protein